MYDLRPYSVYLFISDAYAIGAFWLVGTLAGIRAALAVAAITLSPALPLYARAIRRSVRKRN